MRRLICRVPFPEDDRRRHPLHLPFHRKPKPDSHSGIISAAAAPDPASGPEAAHRPEPAVAVMDFFDQVLIPDADVAVDADVDAGANAAPGHEEDVEAHRKTQCVVAVVELFPDICNRFLAETCEKHNYDYQAIVGGILDLVDSGTPYPRRSTRKRKLSLVGRGLGTAGPSSQASRGNEDDEDEADAVLDQADAKDDPSGEKRLARAMHAFHKGVQSGKAVGYVKLACKLQQQAYPFVPHRFVTAHLEQHDNCLLLALLDLDAQITTTPPEQLPFALKKTKTPRDAQYTRENLLATIRDTPRGWKRTLLNEYRVAIHIRDLRCDRRKEAKRHEANEAQNFADALRDGTVRDCECCYTEVAFNRTVHCDGSLAHFFCKDCARRMAESQVGLSKYALTCMSTDSCDAGFSHDQQQLFLDDKTAVALGRIEQEHVLRVAGLENLETCPFCPFAMEYPPTSVNKVFECQNPDCEAVSCRLCRYEAHIPRTCAEAEHDRGPVARLTIEEAMSAAMIRKCNKCGTPFIKSEGCNRMACSRAGCGNIQCYVCHKSCGYEHFNDISRGGKTGNCPLFESAEKRHADEVRAAEERARQQVVEANPGMDPRMLHFDLADDLLQRDGRSKRPPRV